MERELFSWTGWDGDMECMTFYNPTLKQQIGNFPAGTKFKLANLMWDKGILQFCNYGEPKGDMIPNEVVGEFKVHLKVG